MTIYEAGKIQTMSNKIVNKEKPSMLHRKSFEARDIEMFIVRLRNSIKFHLDQKGGGRFAEVFLPWTCSLWNDNDA